MTETLVGLAMASMVGSAWSSGYRKHSGECITGFVYRNLVFNI